MIYKDSTTPLTNMTHRQARARAISIGHRTAGFWNPWLHWTASSAQRSPQSRSVVLVTGSSSRRTPQAVTSRKSEEFDCSSSQPATRLQRLACCFRRIRSSPGQHWPPLKGTDLPLLACSLANPYYSYYLDGFWQNHMRELFPAQTYCSEYRT